MRIHVLKRIRFYLPRGVKACTVHLNHEAWVPIASDVGQNMFTIDHIEDMVDILRLEPKPGENSVTGNYLPLF